MNGKPACGHEDCGGSSALDERPSFGRGELSFNGAWEIPCSICARDFEMAHPEYGPCWPDPTDELEAQRDRVAAVLIRSIGKIDGLERANNITQALVFEPEIDPVVATVEMLRHFLVTDAKSVGEQVKKAWEFKL